MTQFITAIDFETAWYRPHSAIALGITRIKDGVIFDSHSWLFRPPGNNIYIRPEFIDIHGIRPEHLRGRPNFEGIWPEIAPFFEDAQMLLAHYAPFDRNVLYSTAEHYGINLPAFDWVCTVNVARTKWPDLENHKLNTVCSHLGIDLDHHDAGSDAHACANIYLRALALAEKAA